MNTRIFKDLSKSSNEELCRGLRKQPLMWVYLTALTVIPYTLAWKGGSEDLMPWQLILIGTAVLGLLILSFVGHKRYCAEMTRRLKDK